MFGFCLLHQPTLVAAVLPSQLQTPQSCQLCLAIANRMLLLLQDGKTEEQIIATLHAACLKLKSPGVSEKVCPLPLLSSCFSDVVAASPTMPVTDDSLLLLGTF